MASFYAKNIIFDGISSDTFGLINAAFETGKQDSNAGSESTILQKYIPRRTTPYYYGRMQNTPLPISLTLFSENAIDGKSRSRISAWLLGRMDYLPLNIVQADLDNVTFYVIFTKAENVYAGNLQRSVKLAGICNAPWGFETPNPLQKSFTGSAIVSESFSFFNTSDDSDYNRPSFSFTTSGIGNSFSITNSTDNGRIFSFTSIDANETITVDNDKGIISSSTGLRRMTNFNKNFFRLVPGRNDLAIAGGITNFTMTSVFARKVGS